MTFERIAAVTFGIFVTATAAAGQQTSNTPQQPPSNSVTERTYAAGNITPWRSVLTRTESTGRELVLETIQAPNVDRRMVPIQETATETIHSSPGTVQIRRDLFGFAGDGRRTLLETTHSQQETQANGETSAVRDTLVPDVNGRVGVSARQIERVRSLAADAREGETTVLVPHYSDGLQEATRTEYVERRGEGVVRRDSTQQVRDVNGRWLTTETRAGEFRDMGASERSEEETIHRLDVNRNLAVAERTVTHRSTTDRGEALMIERYAPDADGRRSDRALALSERVHRTTTLRADGGSDTIEEVEGRSLVAPGEPMRVIRRTVTTIRQAGGDRWVTEQQLFERDVNGRMQLVSTEKEERTSRSELRK